MSKMGTYPLIKAEILGKNKTEDQASFFLFNSETNRGYSVDGLAALLCKRFDGTKTLQELVAELEADYELEPHKFDKDVSMLIQDLENNGLVTLSLTPKE